MYCFSDFCFLCLSNKKQLIYLDTGDPKMSLMKKLTFCISNLVYVQDISDIKICKSCCDLLRIMYEFKTRCLENNKILLGYANLLSEKEPIYANSYVILNPEEYAKYKQKDSEKEIHSPKTEINLNPILCTKNKLNNPTSPHRKLKRLRKESLEEGEIRGNDEFSALNLEANSDQPEMIPFENKLQEVIEPPSSKIQRLEKVEQQNVDISYPSDITEKTNDIEQETNEITLLFSNNLEPSSSVCTRNENIENSIIVWGDTSDTEPDVDEDKNSTKGSENSENDDEKIIILTENVDCVRSNRVIDSSTENQILSQEISGNIQHGTHENQSVQQKYYQINQKTQNNQNISILNDASPIIKSNANVSPILLDLLSKNKAIADNQYLNILKSLCNTQISSPTNFCRKRKIKTPTQKYTIKQPEPPSQPEDYEKLIMTSTVVCNKQKLKEEERRELEDNEKSQQFSALEGTNEDNISVKKEEVDYNICKDSEANIKSSPLTFKSLEEAHLYWRQLYNDDPTTYEMKAKRFIDEYVKNSESIPLQTIPQNLKEYPQVDITIKKEPSEQLYTKRGPYQVNKSVVNTGTQNLQSKRLTINPSKATANQFAKLVTDPVLVKIGNCGINRPTQSYKRYSNECYRCHICNYETYTGNDLIAHLRQYH